MKPLLCLIPSLRGKVFNSTFNCDVYGKILFSIVSDEKSAIIQIHVSLEVMCPSSLIAFKFSPLSLVFRSLILMRPDVDFFGFIVCVILIASCTGRFASSHLGCFQPYFSENSFSPALFLSLLWELQRDKRQLSVIALQVPEVLSLFYRSVFSVCSDGIFLLLCPGVH